MYAFADQEREFSRALRKERSEGDRQRMEEDAKGMYAEGIKTRCDSQSPEDHSGCD